MTINAADILSVTRSVTKEWTKQRKAEERGNKSRSSRRYIYSDRVHFSEVAASILPGAYAHASGNGQYTVSKRQLYYACREKFKEQTGRQLESEYFSGTLLVQFINRNPTLTSTWKITADPRGTLTIPNAGHAVRVPCGTIQIDNHLRESCRGVDIFDIAKQRTEWPALKSGQRYQAVLYIEKEGFEPLLEEARIAERFDLAILSCKGQSVVAGRRFVDEVCAVRGGVPLFVVHDLDKAGFEISQRLTSVSDWALMNDRVTYQFNNKINVTDLGLRLEDVEKYELETESVDFAGHFAKDSICTEAEKAFLRSGQRVELNAFTSPQFIEWLESKLRKHGLGKRLIPNDDVLESAYRRAIVLARVNAAVEEVLEEAIEEAEEVQVPKTLRRQLLKRLAKADEPWDVALFDLADEKFGEIK